MLSIALPVLRQSAHLFGGLKGRVSSGRVTTSLLTGALPKALKRDAQTVQQREFSLQSFSMKSGPSGKAHWPNSTVKLTPKAALLVPSMLRIPAQLT
ncbi:MAG: hypothetical protein WBO95_06285 [Candidatus Dechloromonas phosphoritropha]